MQLNTPYFYTATILNWQRFLEEDEMKMIVINSLKYLVDKSKIKLYAFVILPNRIHLLWELVEMNGKEFPSSSFMKFTGHKFLERLTAYPKGLKKCFVISPDKMHQFWQEKSDGLEVYSEDVLTQKLDYIHDNPVQSYWNLVEDPIDYRFSSLRFCECDLDEFNILRHYMDR